MRYILIYYTGTFNTRHLTKNVETRLKKLSNDVDTYEINPLNNETLDLSSYDVVGIGYPIYGFNAPKPLLDFLKKQKFIKDQKVFIYKNSGETYHANDASSISIVKKAKREKALCTNEYHFIYPYNIHFRFDEHLVKEMLGVNELLLDILEKEITDNIPSIKKYKLIPRLITFIVKLQFLGGPVNSYFYKVDSNKCVKCNMCIANCPTKNIYIDEKDKIKFHHNCLMCMRCSLYCPKDAIRIGFLDSWRVNKPYDFSAIEKLENKEKIITKNTKGFFKCYIETYKNIEKRHRELFGDN